jgi:predicted nucleic acid-binding protein
MKGLFFQYDYARIADYAEIWNTGMFVFDTNVLLNLYRYQERTRDELFNTLDKLSDRVWIPHHVALEFQRNRLAVIAEQNRRFSDISKVIENSRSELTNAINKLQLTKRHALIDPEPLISGFKELTDNFLGTLNELRKGQQELTGPDPIKDRLENLFDTKVGPAFMTQEEVDKKQKEAESRYKNNIPPGYKDDGKDKSGPDEFSYNGIVYKRKYGDFLAWSQLLEHAENIGVKKVIFVTDDSKEDWWYQIDMEGPKTVGPRAELVEEAARVGKIESFLMYKPEGFLKFASEFLAAKISEETLTEVHAVSVENKKDAFSPQEVGGRDLRTLRIVCEWVSGKHDVAYVNDDEFPDILGIDRNDVHGYEIKAFPGNRPSSYHQIIARANRAIESWQLATLTLIFIVSSPNELHTIRKSLADLSKIGVSDSLFICIARLQSHRAESFRALSEFQFNIASE